MSNNPKISVIVPVYNNDQFLSRAIDSILEQGYSDFEVIVVNDGSSDNSEDVAKSYASKDSRVKLINKENGGVSSARNCGLREARGDYLIFIDSDDYVLPGYFQSIYDHINKNSPDLIVYNYKFFKEGVFHEVHKDYLIKNNNVISAEEGIDKLLKNIIPASVCMGAFRKEVIKDLRFNENLRYGEDLLFLFSFIKKAKSINMDCGFFYIYMKDTGGVTTRGYDLDILQGLVLIFKEIELSVINPKGNQRFLDYLFTHLTSHLIHSNIKTLFFSPESRYYGERVLYLKSRSLTAFTYKKLIALLGLKFFYKLLFYITGKK